MTLEAIDQNNRDLYNLDFDDFEEKENDDFDIEAYILDLGLRKKFDQAGGRVEAKMHYYQEALFQIDKDFDEKTPVFVELMLTLHNEFDVEIQYDLPTYDIITSLDERVHKIALQFNMLFYLSMDLRNNASIDNDISSQKDVFWEKRKNYIDKIKQSWFNFASVPVVKWPNADIQIFLTPEYNFFGIPNVGFSVMEWEPPDFEEFYLYAWLPSKFKDIEELEEINIPSETAMLEIYNLQWVLQCVIEWEISVVKSQIQINANANLPSSGIYIINIQPSAYFMEIGIRYKGLFKAISWKIVVQ